MGISCCSDKKRLSGGRKPNFNPGQSPHKKIITISDTEVPCHCSSTAENNITDDFKAKPTNPIGLKLKGGSKGIASSYSHDLRAPKNRIRNNTDPHQPALVAYSWKSNVLQQTIWVEDELLEALSAKPKKQDLIPPSQRLSLSRKSVSYIQQKQNLNQDVIIHEVTHTDQEATEAQTQMYKLVIALREVWIKLDLDKDNFLDLSELTRFCKQIWEEPVEDGGAQKIMEMYAKENPQKGINFHEWCILIKEEDPDLKDFIEEMYEIFVDPASHFVTESELQA